MLTIDTKLTWSNLSLSIKVAKGLLDKSGVEIIGFTKMFPVEPALENFTKFLTDSQKNIEAFFPQIEQIDFYRCMIIVNSNNIEVYCTGCYLVLYISDLSHMQSTLTFLLHMFMSLSIGGLGVLWFAVWLFWFWPSISWGCCVDRVATIKTLRQQHVAVCPTPEEICWWRELLNYLTKWYSTVCNNCGQTPYACLHFSFLWCWWSVLLASASSSPGGSWELYSLHLLSEETLRSLCVSHWLTVSCLRYRLAWWQMIEMIVDTCTQQIYNYT